MVGEEEDWEILCACVSVIHSTLTALTRSLWKHTCYAGLVSCLLSSHLLPFAGCTKKHAFVVENLRILKEIM